jgi:hypothetical protein
MCWSVPHWRRPSSSRGLALTPDSAWRRREEKQGVQLKKQDLPGAGRGVDTGFGALLAVRSDGSVEGAVGSVAAMDAVTLALP